MLDFLINLGGVVASWYLFFEFVTDGNAFLMFLAILLIALTSVTSMNTFNTYRQSRKKGPRY